MLALFVALLASVLLTPEASAQDADETIWASVIFSRTGERTPLTLGTVTTQLTSLGAQQQYQTGDFFRQRYFRRSSDEGGEGNASAVAPFYGLNEDKYDPLQSYILAVDKTYTVSSAQAFMQAFYPPHTLDESLAAALDPTSVLANGTYIPNPLDGYQYPHIQAVDSLSPEYVYLEGWLHCTNWYSAASQYLRTNDFSRIENSSKYLYDAVGPPLLEHVLSENSTWSYGNAYQIYDYLNYQNMHNDTVESMFESNDFDTDDEPGVLSQLRWLADLHQDNLFAKNNDSLVNANAAVRSMSTIAGNTLAAKMLNQLQLSISSRGTQYKLSLLTGEHEPLISLFALLDLPRLNSDFRGLPSFASAAVFELYSPGAPPNNASSSPADLFPEQDDLWVRFLFRNGSQGSLQAFPIFGRGPSQTEMRWSDFEKEMAAIMLDEVGEWCRLCGGSERQVFCPGLDSSGGSSRFGGGSGRFGSGDGDGNGSGGGGGLSPAVGGVVGAIVALLIAGLVFAGLWLIGGFRFRRTEEARGRREPGGGGSTIAGGGFKGSAKLASDPDLVRAGKGGAGASVVRGAANGEVSEHERINSWELKKDVAGVERPGQAAARRPSWDEEDDGDDRIDPFRDPTRPDERV
ncbi:hypothetical protein MBLNU230_g2265t1 [Neophaeotheca triangularis]